MKCRVWVMVMLCALGLASCGGNPCDAGVPKFPGVAAACDLEIASGPEDGAVVRLEVTGNGQSADIFYGVGASSGTRFDTPLPWVFSARAAPGAVLYVSGWADPGTMDVAVKIVVDGKVLATNAASGENANARATATCC